METTKKPTPIAICTTSSMAIILSTASDACTAGAAATDPEMARACDPPEQLPRSDARDFRARVGGGQWIKCTFTHQYSRGVDASLRKRSIKIDTGGEPKELIEIKLGGHFRLRRALTIKEPDSGCRGSSPPVR